MARRRTTVFDLADRILGGTLAEQLTTMRADGCSFDEIAMHLRAAHDIHVTGETVRVWVRERTAA